MPVPIEFAIVEDLRDALKPIAIASGYYYDVLDAAVKLDPNQGVEALVAPSGPRPFIVLEVLPEKWEYFPAEQVRLVLPITIHWVIETNPELDDAKVKTFYQACADVEKAIRTAYIAGNIGPPGFQVVPKIVRRSYDFDGSQIWAEIETVSELNRTYGSPSV